MPSGHHRKNESQDLVPCPASRALYRSDRLQPSDRVVVQHIDSTHESKYMHCCKLWLWFMQSGNCLNTDQQRLTAMEQQRVVSVTKAKAMIHSRQYSTLEAREGRARGFLQMHG